MFKTLRVLVCGGRDFANIPIKKDGNGADTEHPDYEEKMKERDYIYSTLYKLCDEFNLWMEADKDGNTLPIGIFIISGAAKGADSAAIDWAVVNWLEFKEYPADWDTHGFAAGPIRNRQMLEEGKPDLVIAFPGGNGTGDMIRKATRAKIPLRIMKYGEVENDNSI